MIVVVGGPDVAKVGRRRSRVITLFGRMCQSAGGWSLDCRARTIA